MYQLKYDKHKKQIIQIDQYGKTNLITDNFPSEPRLSPDWKKAVFISPLEWEMLGSLYLFNLDNGTVTELITPDQDKNIPKRVEWIDDEHIAIVIGYGLGTVQIGGNIFRLNISNKELKQLTYYQSEIQITDLEFEKEVLMVSGIKYIDDNYNYSVSFNDVISL